VNVKCSSDLVRTHTHTFENTQSLEFYGNEFDNAASEDFGKITTENTFLLLLKVLLLA